MSFVRTDSPEKLWYTACPNANCNKKVTEQHGGAPPPGPLPHPPTPPPGPLPRPPPQVTEQHGGASWRCERCNTEVPNCVRRYVMSATVMDHTGQVRAPR